MIIERKGNCSYSCLNLLLYEDLLGIGNVLELTCVKTSHLPGLIQMLAREPTAGQEPLSVVAPQLGMKGIEAHAIPVLGVPDCLLILRLAAVQGQDTPFHSLVIVHEEHLNTDF